MTAKTKTSTRAGKARAKVAKETATQRSFWPETSMPSDQPSEKPSLPQQTYPIIDLFSGCGGLTLGFLWDRLFSLTDGNPVCRSRTTRPSPFRGVLANDYNEDALATYRANFDTNGQHAVGGSIDEILISSTIPQADVVIGGPPCQGFSLLNKKREGDERRTLWWRFTDVAERSGAKIIVMENVPQLLDGHEFEQIKSRLRSLGFHHLMAGVLCTANYGVPQVRQRAIIMASKVGPIALPIPTHLPPVAIERLNGLGASFQKTPNWVPVSTAFEGLPTPRGIEPTGPNDTLCLHFGRSPTSVSLERYQAVPPGGNRLDLLKNRPDITPDCWVRKKSGGTDLFGRLWWDRPSVTIRTEFYKPEKGRYLHPSEHRPITHREAARIQSFPDSFEFQGNKVEIAKQIGNAVPPLFAHRIALEVERCLEGLTTLDDMAFAARIVAKVPKSKLSGYWNGQTE